MPGLPLLQFPPDSCLPVLASAVWASPAVFAVAAAAGCAAFASGWAIERRRRLHAGRLQQASAAESARLRAQVEEAADPFLVAEGEEGCIVLANRAASELLGHAHGRLVGTDLADLYPEESRHEMSDRYRRSLRRSGVGTHELFLRTADGGAVPVLLRWRAVAAGGQRCMQVSLRDLRPAKAAERELRESEARYAALFESIPIAVLEKDYGVVLDWLHGLRERGVQNITSYLRGRPVELVTLYGSVQIRSANRSALRGMDLLEAAREGAPASPDEIPPHLLHLFLRELEALWDDRAHMSSTIEHVKSDGSIGHALVHWTLPRQENNTGLRTALVVFTDLTELRSAQERLHLSEERPRLALQGFNVGIWELDLLSGAGDYSERWRDILGYGPEEVGYRREDWAELVHPEDRARVEAAQAAHLAGESQRYEAEYRLRCKDGSYKWILDRGQAVRDPMGRALRVVGALEDISEKKAAEEALKAGQTRYRQLFENNPIAIVEADLGALVAWFAGIKSGTRSFEEQVLASPRTFQEAGTRIRFTELNPAALRLFRTPDRESVFAALTPGGEETRRMWTEIFHALWHGRNELEGESALKPALGAPVRAMYRWWLPAQGGDSVRCLLVLADLSEIRRAEAALAAEQLRSSKLESLGILAGGIAHDFNNLLTVVMGNLTLAMMEPQAMSSAGRWLRESERGVLKARDLTQQLLTIAKGGDPVRSAVALADVVREAAEFALHGSKVRPVFSFAPGLPPAEVDKGQIGQVVQNLVINAVQAMPQGGTIRLSLADASSSKAGADADKDVSVLLTVEDNGVGIPEENLEKIFDPYFTTKAQGSGLGLATVYSIVRKHGGDIEVSSTVGKGTCFRIRLPASRGPAARHEVVDTTGPRVRTGRILFMDDEEPLRRLGQALLQSLGYDVRAVADGSAVAGEYETARRIGRPFDLVLLDLTVPGGMGAVEALKTVRVKDPAVRAVVMSGYASDPVCIDPGAHGFRGVWSKPYRVVDLGRTIQAALA
jgi:PAS domain S-box-containing protein